MTTPVSRSDHVAPRAALSAGQHAASRHAVWVGAAALVTDQVGRVLLVHPTYREDDRWLLPGGVVEPGEHPHVTCRREITEELGLANHLLSGVLAVNSLSPHHPDSQTGTPFPGEIRFVFDGGTLTPDQVEAIRLPREELSETAQREAIEETGLELGLETPRLLLTHFLHAGPRLPLNKVGLIFDGGRLNADQLCRIRLDPAEHDMWAVHDLATWQELMTPRAFARLDAIERARLGEGPAYLISHT
ncbi:NUDIX domain-containing protein [Streptomyces sp. NPDC020800]|uniref:NUDIX domain-containing protein n=1 Tax=Streptomyces sp. NPDC020800 TaxID=3365092 RepID=UPI00378AA9A2